MKFLIDNALPPRLAHLLVAAGYDAVHVGAYGMHAASDEEILARALQEVRIVVSADTDSVPFSPLRRRATHRSPSSGIRIYWSPMIMPTC